MLLLMLELDISGALGKVITPSLGIPEQEISAMRGSMRHYLEEIRAERAARKHPWADAPYDEKGVSQTTDLAAKLLEPSDAGRRSFFGNFLGRGSSRAFDTVLWVGIGGSSLAPRVIEEVFEGAETPDLVVLDTVDPSVLLEQLKVIAWERTLLVIASKSGGTLEPMSLTFLLLEELKAALGERAAAHVVVITDPAEGLLHDIALRDGYPILPLHSGIGGRYSVFTPIGLLPLALLGGDVQAFCRGARDMDAACQAADLEANPAALLAAAQFILDVRRNYSVRVIMPYATRLQSLGRWEQQLLAESLGKTEAAGPIPLASIGSQDQHSMLQQWIQGRRLHWHLFIRETEKPRLALPEITEPSLAFLSGKTLGQVLDALAEGTARSLTVAKRPHATITLPRLDAYHLGQLFFLFMAEVVLLGKLYRVDPYGQPGVEMGKKIAKEILSRGT